MALADKPEPCRAHCISGMHFLTGQLHCSGITIKEKNKKNNEETVIYCKRFESERLVLLLFSKYFDPCFLSWPNQVTISTGRLMVRDQGSLFIAVYCFLRQETLFTVSLQSGV